MSSSRPSAAPTSQASICWTGPALKAGERVLVTGASGGVGSGIVQLGRARGAIPYAVVGPGKEQALLDSAPRQWSPAGPRRPAGGSQRGSTAGRPIDVVADLVAARCSTICCASSGPRAATPRPGAIGGPVVQLDLRTVYLKHLALHGSSQGTRARFPPPRSLYRTGHDPAACRRRLQALGLSPRADRLHGEAVLREARNRAGLEVLGWPWRLSERRAGSRACRQRP